MRWYKFKNLIVVLLVVVLVLMSTAGASAGHDGTGVYVNNYELAPAELHSLECLLGDVPPGFYWFDQYGNFGVVGNRYISINLYNLKMQNYCSPQPEPSDTLPVIPGLGPHGDGSYGPYATIRRAEEVVDMFIRMGYPNTIQYHNGDGQYVFPRR